MRDATDQATRSKSSAATYQLPESDLAPPEAASTLFWMLPGPAAFLEHVTGLLNRHRSVAVHLRERTVLGHQTFVEKALSRAVFDGSDATSVVTLRVHDASQIACDIAEHLNSRDGSRQVSPTALGELHTRKQRAESGAAAPHTIVLRPRGHEALRAAWTYLGDFSSALPGSAGNTRIVLLRIDDDPTWSTTDLDQLRKTGHFEAAVFDGALTADEMASYLGMRMAIAGGGRGEEDVFTLPTNRLARSLIAEFASFDAHFAEGLMRMHEDELMLLPQSLGALAARLPVSDTVWRQTSEERGTLTTIDGKTIVHTLHVWHLANHAGPHRDVAVKELARKRWRAHLTALMPWFEELRHALINELRPLLQQHLAPTHGERVRALRINGREMRTAIDDLECGDIAAMTRDDVPLRGRNQREREALNLSFKVSRVRNEIAHLRAPQLAELQKLIESLADFKRARQQTLAPPA
jgi:hypothetical protein